MKRAYHFFINPFMVLCLHDYALGVHMSTVYYNALVAAAPTNALAAARLLIYTPIHQALLDSYAAWKAQGGMQEGETLNVMQLLVLLTTKVNLWDNMIRIVYGKTTARYKALFPDGHYSFLTGSKLDIINAIKALSIAIGSDASLAAVKLLVDAAYTQLKNANDLQTGSKSTTGTLSANVKLAVENDCVAQYGDMCLFIAHTPTTPELAGNFFDMAALRNGPQVFYTKKVKGGAIYTVAKHSLVPTDEIWMENIGVTVLKFYVALMKGGVCVGMVFIALNPGESRTVLAPLLGNIADNHYVCCENIDAITTGEFNLEFL